MSLPPAPRISPTAPPSLAGAVTYSAKTTCPIAPVAVDEPSGLPVSVTVGPLLPGQVRRWSPGSVVSRLQWPAVLAYFAPSVPLNRKPRVQPPPGVTLI